MTLQDLRIDKVTPTAVTRESLLERLRMTALSAGYLLSAVPALILLILTVVGLPLVFAVGSGLALIWLAVPATALLTRAHRTVSGAVLGTEIEAAYADDRGRNVLTKPWVWLRDPSRWRDVAFLAFSATGGFALSLAPVALLVGPMIHIPMVVFFAHSLWWLPIFISTPMLIAWWFVTPPLVKARAMAERGILDGTRVEQLERRVEEVATSRSEVLDHSAAEIRRIERDLHDGAQARIAAATMGIGLAEKLIKTDPEAAVELLREARETNTSGLEELRAVVRGIHPPVLADRGLADAIEALTVSVPMPVTLVLAAPPSLPAPVESAAYFAVAECLANIVKHASATRAWITTSYAAGALLLEIGDDGQGGADPDGSGIAGVRGRLAAFDGTMKVASPAGGPTVITMEIPCQLPSGPSSEKTKRSSGSA